MKLWNDSCIMYVCVVNHNNHSAKENEMKRWPFMILCLSILFILNESGRSQTPDKVRDLKENVQKNQPVVETLKKDGDESKTVENSLAKGGKSVYILTNQAPIRSTSSVASWDFTTGSDKYYGGASGAKEIDTGVWGMIGGNARNSDQSIFASDLADVRTEFLAGASGYNDCDLNLDGDVFASDYALGRLNMLAGASSSVP